MPATPAVQAAMTTLLLGRGWHPRVQGDSGTPLATPGLGSRSVGQHLLASGILWGFNPFMAGQEGFSICLGCRASALMSVQGFPTCPGPGNK